MDDNYPSKYIDEHTPASLWSLWTYCEDWLLKPLVRGVSFGVGAFISIRLVLPFLSKKLAVTYE